MAEEKKEKKGILNGLFSKKDELPNMPEGFELMEPGFEPAPPGMTLESIKEIEPPEGFDFREKLPPGFEPVPEFEKQTEEGGIGSKIAGRFLGTDVDDPLTYTRLGATVTGAVVGGVIGSRTPIAPGPAGIFINPITGSLVGSATGVLLSTVAPEVMLDLGERVGVLEPGTRLAEGLSNEDLRTVAEGEVLLDLATGGGFTVLRGVGRGASRLLTGPKKEGLEIARLSGERGIHLMPVQVGNRRIARGFVSVMGRFPFIGSKIRKSGQEAEEALRVSLQNAPERVGPLRTFSEISDDIFRDANNLVESTGKYFGKKYTELFARADELGVQAIPKETVAKGDEILKKLRSEAPIPVFGQPKLGPALQKVADFIDESITPLRAETTSGVAFSKQSLTQMDGLIEKIDQEIASLEPGQKKFAMKLLIQLRQAAQLDAAVNLRGPNAAEIGRNLRELDTEFSQTMSQLFETATAKKFASVQKRGLRGVTSDEAMRTPVDQLSRLVVKLDSPQAMEELSRIVTPETYKAVAAKVIDDAVLDSMQITGDVGKQFNPSAFAKRLGLDKPNSSRRKAVTEMLERAGGDLTIDDLDIYLKAARVIADTEIPNVSTFIARRATIGGFQGVINGLVPGYALAGGTYAASGVFGLLAFLGGGRLISATLANPKSVRMIRDVAKAEALDIGVHRKLLAGTARLGMDALVDAGEMTTEDREKLEKIMNTFLDEAARQMEDLRDETK